MRLCVVQAVLPLYSISFFNQIVDLYPEIDLIVLADLETPNSLNQYRKDGCRFRAVHLPNEERRGVARRPGLLQTLREQEADVVIFSGYARDLSQLWAMLAYRLQGKRIAAWGMFHRIGGPRLVSKLYYRLVGLLADKCLAYTRVGAGQLVNLGVPKRKVVVVGTAIDERVPFAEAQARTPEELLDFRRTQGLDGRHVILQVVRLSRIKRPELLVEAAVALQRQRDDLLFVLIGDGEMRQELEAMVARKGLQCSFRFLGAIYDEGVLSRWYMSAEVFVVPTCIGLGAHHAMSYGLPVVTDDSLDSQASEFEILAEGLNALTYREGDAHDLARVLDRLVSDQALRQTLSVNARKTIENTHNLERKTRNFAEQAFQLAQGRKA